MTVMKSEMMRCAIADPGYISRSMAYSAMSENDDHLGSEGISVGEAIGRLER